MDNRNPLNPLYANRSQKRTAIRTKNRTRGDAPLDASKSVWMSILRRIDYELIDKSIFSCARLKCHVFNHGRMRLQSGLLDDIVFKVYYFGFDPLSSSRLVQFFALIFLPAKQE
jgi:hypothetical protein